MADDPGPEPLINLFERRRQERRAVEEAGGGESEGFELAEEELIEHASHGDDRSDTRVLTEARIDEEPVDATYGEADAERKPD
jgi:hypothetical protein